MRCRSRINESNKPGSFWKDLPGIARSLAAVAGGVVLIGVEREATDQGLRGDCRISNRGDCVRMVVRPALGVFRLEDVECRQVPGRGIRRLLRNNMLFG